MTDALPPIELAAPDITPHRRGNTGIDYVTTLAADRPGPHLVVTALMHGNEIAGAIALDQIFRMGLRPSRGRLSLVFANTAAYRAFERENPYASRFIDEDMNRVWADSLLDGPRDSLEIQRARQLRPLYDTADVVLDLHSMSAHTPPLTLCGRTARGRALALRLGYPAWVVADEGHAAGRRLIDRDAFIDPAGERTAILVECGQHWRQETAVVALESCLRMLLVLDMVEPDAVRPRLMTRGEPQHVVEVTQAVTVANEGFRFLEPFVGMEVIERAGTLIGWDGDIPLRTPYDRCVLIMPARRPRPGQTAVRLGRMTG
ncbi:succinylglutamate desuccinylase/aspartoacylase domain-containing protein [Azospirillum thermophilum]|uniref:Succinylglutamate desuccinylase n=1 Tax=Azospirillum thermophilum TaxID=2202148 RepID=A0A2S2CPJ9_9PROT|nr:succinylglutamate desuccinylase/aspartoacylase family protein [Azospirillum thermophilum]AWK86453.1 succinylglutamate desuccinylase [Azospirillum thermophilum]